MGQILAPGNIARSAVLARLASTTTGFNPSYAASLSNYPGTPSMTIDFTTGAKSLNFFLARIDVEDIVETATSKFPIMCLWQGPGSNGNTQKFTRFSGLVRVGIDVHLSYKTSQALRNYEAWPDAVVDTVITVMHNPDTQDWGYNLVYNGQLSYESQKLRRGAENWLQTVYFQTTFEVVLS
jgi:hypothetical protein